MKSDTSIHAAVWPVRSLLEELDALLSALQDGQYVRRPVGAFDSSIGGHVRHCLDHVEALCGAADTGELCYDRRDRGTEVERDPLAARRRLGELIRRLESLRTGGNEPLARPLRMTVAMTTDGPSLAVGSTLGREFAFVLSHTIHHNAIIGAMARTLGVSVPERFGYAPSTVAYLKQGSCAR